MPKITKDPVGFTTPDQTRKSQGIRAARTTLPVSVGTQSALTSGSNSRGSYSGSDIDDLLGTVAGVVGPATEAVNFQITSNIKDELRERKEQVDAEFGVRDAAIQEASFDSGLVPEDLERSKQVLDRTTQQFRQGRLKASTYWARMESITRQMRARYPGHIDEIDQISRSLTGALPANALRQSLMRESLATAPGDKRQKEKLSLISKYGQHAGPVATNRYANDEIGDLEYAQLGARVQFLRNTQEVEEAKLDLANKRNTNVLNTTRDAAESKVWTDIGVVLHQSDTFNRFLDNVESFTQPGAKLSVDDQTNLRLSFVNMKAQAIKAMNSTLLDPRYAKMRSSDKTALINSVNNWFEQVSSAVDKNEPALIPAYMDQLKGILESGQIEMLRRSDTMRQIATMKETVGEETTRILLGGQFRGLLRRGLEETRKMFLIEGGMPEIKGSSLTQDAKTLARQGHTPSLHKDYVANGKKMMTGKIVGGRPGEGEAMQRKYADYFFNSKNFDYIDSLPRAHRYDAFMQLTDETTRRRMEKFLSDGSSEGLQTWVKYTNWLARNFESMISTQVNDINAGIINRQNVTVDFDPETTRFTIRDLVPEGPQRDPNTFTGITESSNESVLQNSVTLFNNTLQNVRKVVEIEVNRGSGTKEQKEQRVINTLATFIQAAGVKLGAEKEGPLFAQMLEGMRKAGTQPKLRREAREDVELDAGRQIDSIILGP